MDEEGAASHGKDVEMTFAGVMRNPETRNSLVLVEMAGATDCQVEAVIETSTGDQLAPARPFALAPHQYLQIQDFVVSSAGFGLSTFSEFSDVVLRTRVSNGACQVIPFVTINNNISKQPLVIPLSQPGMGTTRRN